MGLKFLSSGLKQRVAQAMSSPCVEKVDTNAKMMKKWDMMIAGHKKQVDYRFVKENFDQFLSSSSSDISPPVTPRIVENTPKRKREVIAKKWRCKIRSLYAQMCGPVRVEVDREMYNPALKPAKVSPSILGLDV